MPKGKVFLAGEGVIYSSKRHLTERKRGRTVWTSKSMCVTRCLFWVCFVCFVFSWAFFFVAVCFPFLY